MSSLPPPGFQVLPTGLALRVRGLVSQREALLLGFVLSAGLVFALTNDFFLTGRNLSNVAVQSSMITLVSFGMTVVIISGGIDLSVGAAASMSSVVSVWVLINAGAPIAVAMLAGVAIAAVIGIANGLVITCLRVPDFIATLGMLTTLQGVSFLVSGGFTIRADNEQFGVLADATFGPFPIPFVLVAVAFLLTYALLRHSTLGRSFYAVGGNREASRLAGLPVARIIVLAYLVSGLLAGAAGLIAASRTQAGSPIIGTGWELQAIAIVILGGANLFGGSGGVVGTVLAGFLIGSLNNWMSLQAYESWLRGIVQGAILIAVVAVSQQQWRARQRAFERRMAHVPALSG